MEVKCINTTVMCVSIRYNFVSANRTKEHFARKPMGIADATCQHRGKVSWTPEASTCQHRGKVKTYTAFWANVVLCNPPVLIDLVVVIGDLLQLGSFQKELRIWKVKGQRWTLVFILLRSLVYHWHFLKLHSRVKMDSNPSRDAAMQCNNESGATVYFHWLPVTL